MPDWVVDPTLTLHILRLTQAEYLQTPTIPSSKAASFHGSRKGISASATSAGALRKAIYRVVILQAKKYSVPLKSKKNH